MFIFFVDIQNVLQLFSVTSQNNLRNNSKVSYISINNVSLNDFNKAAQWVNKTMELQKELEMLRCVQRLTLQLSYLIFCQYPDLKALQSFVIEMFGQNERTVERIFKGDIIRILCKAEHFEFQFRFYLNQKVTFSIKDNISACGVLP